MEKVLFDEIALVKFSSKKFHFECPLRALFLWWTLGGFLEAWVSPV